MGNKKIVYRYTLDKKYDCEFKSLADAAKALNLKSKSGISAAIKDASKSSGGYYWSLIKSDILPEVQHKKVFIPQSIDVFDIQGNFIKNFETISECIKEYPYCRKVLRGERKSSQGFTFKLKI